MGILTPKTTYVLSVTWLDKAVLSHSPAVFGHLGIYKYYLTKKARGSRSSVVYDNLQASAFP